MASAPCGSSGLFVILNSSLSLSDYLKLIPTLLGNESSWNIDGQSLSLHNFNPIKKYYVSVYISLHTLILKSSHTDLIP